MGLGRIDPEGRQLMGVGANLIRIPVGMESIEDIKPDCEGVCRHLAIQ